MTRERPRVLVVHPDLRASGGGGCALTAFALEGLARHLEVEVLTRRPVDFAALDRTFGTRLAARPVANPCFSAAASALWAAVPDVLERVRRAVTARECGRVAARGYDLLLSTNEEYDFGALSPGVLYVNWPLTTRPATPWRALFRRAVGWIAPWDVARVAQNAFLANSEFSAAAVERMYGVKPAIVYPPVAGAFPDVPWDARRDGFVCLGRLSIAEKDLLKVIAIVERVRARGHDVTLDLVGTKVTAADLARLRAEAGARPWLSVHVDLPRPRVVELLSARRYGLHGNVGEHFGIAVAEYLRAGLLPFVPECGGCAEILGRDPRFLYASADDAVERIVRALSDADEHARMRAFVRERRDLFSVERFQEELLACVRRAL